MIFKSITMHGIKSFKEKVTFTFPTVPGLYFMCGENLVEPSLGANGTGKSSTWDCLCWILYGKTLRGLRSPDVKTWYSSKPNYGQLEFIDEEGKQRTVYKSIAPNKLKLDGTDISQEDLNVVVKIPYESFLYAIIYGQQNSKFFDLRPTEALKLFTEILELDAWIERSEEAAKVATSSQTDRHFFIEELSAIQGRLDTTMEYAEEYSRSEAQWVSEQKKKIEKVSRTKHGKKTEDLKKTLKLLDKHIDVVTSNLKELMLKRQTKLKNLANYTTGFEDINRQIGRALGRQEAAMEAYTAFRRFRNAGKRDKCGVCLQPITQEHFKKRMLVLKNAWNKAGEPVSKLLEQRVGLEEKMQKTKKQESSLDAMYHSLYRELVDIKTDKDSTNDRIKKNKRRNEEKSSLIADLKAETNPFSKSYQQALEKVAKLRRSLGLFKRSLEYCETELEYSNYWVKGFKEVRLFLVSEFLIQFEIATNNCLSQLGMEDWGINYEVEKQTKSKTIKKGFSVLVDSPYNEVPVSWESWSGGEAQRLTLAGSLGLGNLILDRYGVTSNIEVWDEPSSWLSEEGIQDLLETLAIHAKQENKQVWIADQRFLEYGNFDNVVTVVKDETGSHFKWK